MAGADGRVRRCERLLLLRAPPRHAARRDARIVLSTSWVPGTTSSATAVATGAALVAIALAADDGDGADEKDDDDDDDDGGVADEEAESEDGAADGVFFLPSRLNHCSRCATEGPALGVFSAAAMLCG